VLLQLETAPAAFDAGWVVVTRVGAASLGILVDGVADTEEIVVKPMAPILRHTTLFGGSTILGDGSVIMVLDPAGIARASRIEAPAVGLPSALTPCFGCPTDRWCCCPSPTC
jgi:two-component system chemotaxis sensor kinase CheA